MNRRKFLAGLVAASPAAVLAPAAVESVEPPPPLWRAVWTYQHGQIWCVQVGCYVAVLRVTHDGTTWRAVRENRPHWQAEAGHSFALLQQAVEWRIRDDLMEMVRGIEQGKRIVYGLKELT